MNEKIGKLILVGGVGDNRWGDRFRQGDSCYDIDGISPTLTAQPVGNTGGFSPLFIDMEMIRCLRLVRTEQAKQCRKQYENHEVDIPRSQLQELEIRDDDCSNTITTVLKDNLVLENSDMETVKIKCANSQGFKECEIGGVFDAAFADTDRHSRVVDNGQVSPTLTSESQQVCKVESPIAIRKLTPRECWRLMDFTDDQFDRAEKVNSSTQLYKQAGNSIVVACLEAIFSQLGIGEEWNKRDFDSDER